MDWVPGHLSYTALLLTHLLTAGLSPSVRQTLKNGLSPPYFPHALHTVAIGNDLWTWHR